MEQNRSIGRGDSIQEPAGYTLVGHITDWLLYSSVFISCCAFSLTVETYLLAGLPVSLPMAAFAALATLFTYNLSSVQSMLRHPRQVIYRHSRAFSQRNKKLLAALGLVSLAAAAGLYISYGLRINIWLLLHLAIISVGYTVPVAYKSKKVRPLRKVPLLKVFLIAYVWAAVTALFPLLQAGIGIWEPLAQELFLRRFLFILALALLFDIRDYTYDRTTNTLTFPGWIGVRNTKLLSLGLLGLYVLLLVYTERGVVLWVLVSSAAAAAVVVFLSSENKPRVYYALLVDGAMLLHAGLVYLAMA